MVLLQASRLLISKQLSLTDLTMMLTPRRWRLKLLDRWRLKQRKTNVILFLLEPIMKVEVTVPEEYMGDVMGMLNSRRGRIEGMDSRAGAQIIRAKVPLAEMFGYSTTLRSGTQGRGVFSMELSHYEEVPKSISEEIIAKAQRR